jgi:hypothetical protein
MGKSRRNERDEVKRKNKKKTGCPLVDDLRTAIVQSMIDGSNSK